MNVFFDTSAVVKYFHVEAGTEQVTALIQDACNEVWLSELVRIEFISAIYKKYRTGAIDDKQLEEALAGFETDYASFHVEPLGPPVTDKAEHLLRKYAKTEGLRTLDALHMAAFSLLADKTWIFVAADSTLCHAAELEGYNVVNPACD